MSRTVSPCIEAVVEELSAAGIKSRIEYGGKHAHVVWLHNNKERRFATSLTPGDWRSAMNSRTEIRRILRNDGIIDVPETLEQLPRVFLQNGATFVTSREVADHFSKQHKNVLQAIDGLLNDLGDEFGRLNFQPSSYLTQQGKSQRAYNMTRDGFTLLAMGFTGTEATRWKVRYIEAFNAMELELQRLGRASQSDDFAARVTRLEGDLEALTELVLAPLPPRDGFTVVKPHYRRRRKSQASAEAT